MRKTIGRRLTLHRETLRQLSGRELARVAGGGAVGDLVDDVVESMMYDPKSNAWTGATPKYGVQFGLVAC